eukprot:4971700-Amphidinium_carterae.2
MGYTVDLPIHSDSSAARGFAGKTENVRGHVQAELETELKTYLLEFLRASKEAAGVETNS